MSQTNATIRWTIRFEDPYWIAVVEIEAREQLYAARHIFGAEPSDQEIVDFIKHELLAVESRAVVGVPLEKRTTHSVRFKRMQREIRREMQFSNDHNTLSKAHEAMRLQLEQSKQVRQIDQREERERQRARKRELAREKARNRHRGH